MVGSVPHIECARNFIMTAVLICFGRSKIFGLCRILEGLTKF